MKALSIRQPWASVAVLIASTLAAAAQTTPTDLPASPPLRTAAKALRGDYGRLQPWQRVGYRAALNGGAERLTAWVTQYYPSEGYDRGEPCRWWARGCSERVIAANELPPYSLVWVPGVGIRQVLDTGMAYNDDVARRKGADLWVDVWVPRAGDHGFVTDVRTVYVLRRGR